MNSSLLELTEKSVHSTISCLVGRMVQVSTSSRTVSEPALHDIIDSFMVKSHVPEETRLLHELRLLKVGLKIL